VQKIPEFRKTPETIHVIHPYFLPFCHDYFLHCQKDGDTIDPVTDLTSHCIEVKVWGEDVCDMAIFP